MNKGPAYDTTGAPNSATAAYFMDDTRHINLQEPTIQIQE